MQKLCLCCRRGAVPAKVVRVTVRSCPIDRRGRCGKAHYAVGVIHACTSRATVWTCHATIGLSHEQTHPTQLFLCCRHHSKSHKHRKVKVKPGAATWLGLSGRQHCAMCSCVQEVSCCLLVYMETGAASCQLQHPKVPRLRLRLRLGERKPREGWLDWTFVVEQQQAMGVQTRCALVINCSRQPVSVYIGLATSIRRESVLQVCNR